MNSSRELAKINSEKKALSSSCSSKKSQNGSGRIKSGLAKNLARGDHSNKSKVSGCGQRKKISSNSNRKDQVDKKDKDGTGFKNIKKKIIGQTGQDKENGKNSEQFKQKINSSQVSKPKTSNSSTPRDQFNTFVLKSQKTESDEKQKSLKKLESIPKIKKQLKTAQKKVSLQDFQIGKRLGKGRFGDVFIVKEKQLGLIMALKVINKKELRESQMENQLLFQIKIQSFLNHPNALRMFGYFNDEKNIYLLLQLASSGCLFRQLKSKGHFTQDQAAYYLRQIITGLKCLHGNSIMHRDIKPENILNSFGVLKLCDFGWAVYSPLYQRQTFCGTLDYVPPEIVTGEFYDEKVDIWCIGVLCYQLCTGHAPFEAKNNEMETYDKILAIDLVFPPGLSQEVVDFISHLLTKDPKQRMTFEEIQSHPWMRRFENESGRLISKDIWEHWQMLKNSP